MYGQPNHEVTVVFVEFKLGWRRAVFFHRAHDLGDAGGSAFGEIQLLEKFADATVPIPARDGFTGSELSQTDRTVGAGITEHDQLVAVDADFNRLAHVVTTVIDRVDHRFFNRGIGKVFDSCGFGSVVVLD